MGLKRPGERGARDQLLLGKRVLMPDTPGLKLQLSNLLAGDLRQVTYISRDLNGLVYPMRIMMPTRQSYSED